MNHVLGLTIYNSGAEYGVTDCCLRYLVDNTVDSTFLTDADARTGVRVGASVALTAVAVDRGL